VNLAKTLYNTGTSYRFLNEYEKAIPYYMEGYAIFEKLGDAGLVAKSYDILQVIYQDLKQYPKALEYGQKAVQKSLESKNPLFVGTAYLNLGISYFRMSQYEEARHYMERSLEIGRELSNQQLISSALLGLGGYFSATGQYEKLRPVYEESLRIGRAEQDRETEISSLNGLAMYRMSVNDYEAAAVAATEALSVADQYGFLKEKADALDKLADVHFGLRQAARAQDYRRQASALRDSIFTRDIQKIAVDAEKKLEAARKEAEIQQLKSAQQVQELSLQRRTILGIVALLSAVSLAVIALLGRRNTINKNKIQQQRISELEREKTMAAMEAVLKGEEQERTRLAREIHDGLGGTLSSIKYGMQSMKADIALSRDGALVLDRNMDMLDSSIREIRRVAHNLMPESLDKFGLHIALRDYCGQVSQSGILDLHYQSVGMEDVKLDRPMSIAVFRIVQELVNNVIRHASARQAIVQLHHADGTLSITVEDDGKGFNPAVLETTGGIGWSNIRSRVALINGSLDVESAPGKGTSVHIEMKTA
jgi:signal transduction histidine kinase